MKPETRRDTVVIALILLAAVASVLCMMGLLAHSIAHDLASLDWHSFYNGITPNF